MKLFSAITATFTASLLMSAGAAYADGHSAASAHGEIVNNKGQMIGEVVYSQGSEGVLVEIQVRGLPAGKHGMHFHSAGTCKDNKNFKMSKGHINPYNRPHGYLHPEGPHEGDLPNLIVGADGTAHVELYTELVAIGGHGDRPALLDDDGSALVIHANPDDHMTQPIGGSGGRIACSVVEMSK